MAWVGAIVAYICFWWLCWFCVLPFGVHVPETTGEGFAPSAPEQPKLGRKALITSLLAFLCLGLLEIALWLGWFDVFVDSWRVTF